MPSLPVRERGSKPPLPYVNGLDCGSLPVRERGSKRQACEATIDPATVAPRAGARIETATGSRWRRSGIVAPRAGARIETPH